MSHIRPEVDKVVWFFRTAGQAEAYKLGDKHAQPLEAKITFVHDDRCVNITGTDQHGEKFDLSGVTLLQEHDIANGPHARWSDDDIYEASVKAAAIREQEADDREKYYPQSDPNIGLSTPPRAALLQGDDTTQDPIADQKLGTNVASGLQSASNQPGDVPDAGYLERRAADERHASQSDQDEAVKELEKPIQPGSNTSSYPADDMGEKL